MKLTNCKQKLGQLTEPMTYIHSQTSDNKSTMRTNNEHDNWTIFVTVTADVVTEAQIVH